MKKRWILLSNKIFSGILILLGFPGCNLVPADEYGTPYAKYEIKGKVLDAQTESGIPNIEVIISSKPYGYHADTLKSDSKGEFICQGESFSTVDEYRIICNDIDGEANGGTYKTDSIDIKTHKTESGKGWYGGKGEAEVTIKLEKE